MIPVLLFLSSFSFAAKDPAACQAAFTNALNLCMSNGCSGLITTGSSAVGRSPEECRTECNLVAKRESEPQVACGGTVQWDAEDEGDQAPSQAQSYKQAAKTAGQGENDLKTKQTNAAEAKKNGAQIQDGRLRSSDDILRKWDQELTTGSSRDFPKDRAQWENDRKLVQEAARARANHSPFPEEKSNRAKLPAIRSDLWMLSRAQRMEKNASRELGIVTVALTTLMKLRSAGEKSAAGLGNKDRNSTATVQLAEVEANERNTAPGMKGALNASLTKAEAEISEAGPDTQDSKAIEEHPANPSQIGEARAGEKPVTASNLKARLRELLRRRAAGEALSPEDLEDIPAEFLGELGPSVLADDGKATPEKADEFLTNLEAKAFPLSGSETDAEVRRIQDELGSELAREEGVLPAESLSLFARVKAAYHACAAKKCVFRPERNLFTAVELRRAGADRPHPL